MPIITVVILVNSRQDKRRQGKTGRNIHRSIAYNDNEKDNDNNNDKNNHYSMNSDGMKIIS